MNLGLAAALFAGRMASAGIRGLRAGGGTVVPGRLVGLLHPNTLQEIAARLRQGAVLISGTNGKTTTARMIASAAMAVGLQPIHNRSGSNLLPGILSTLASRTRLDGSPSGDLGVFEVDEAYVLTAVEVLKPRILVLTNLFRDQLDRYGEVDFLTRLWKRAVASLSQDATVVVNVDDPGLAYVARDSAGRVLTFGMADQSVGGPGVPHEADRRLCPACSGRLAYLWCYYGHLGRYRCPDCGWERPPADLTIASYLPTEAGSAELTLTWRGQQTCVELPLPGLYNAYNAAAAAAAVLALGFEPGAWSQALGALKGPFGRHERIDVGAGALVLTLVKNPVGFNQALASLDSPPALAVIAINDRLADGTDVSWLWDVDFESLAEYGMDVVCTGLRAHDMALRLKYAGASRVRLESDLERAIEAALPVARGGGNAILFATYTATLEARRILQKKALVPPFWED